MKKGFVLMETIVVIVVISVALLTIFASYNKILSKVRTENKYDTSEYIYMTEYIKDKICISNVPTTYLNSLNSSQNLNLVSYVSGNAQTLYGLEKVYKLSNINFFSSSYRYFDAYMIDYIRKLDVSNNDVLVIAEYKRPVRNNNYSIKKDTNNRDLYETYIASLECPI